MTYTTAGTWGQWNFNSTTTSVTTCSADIIWTTWNGYSGMTSATASVSSGTATVWAEWNNNYYASYSPLMPSAEELERQKKEREEQASKLKEREEKARTLLKEVLSEEQDKQFEEKGFFELVSVGSGNRYRVEKGRSRNVVLLDKDGKVARRLCFHPREYVHDFDTMAAQKLMLETDEEVVRKVANYS